LSFSFNSIGKGHTMRPIDYARRLFRYIDMDSPPVKLQPLLERFGVRLYYEDFKKVDGIAIKSPKVSIIVVNKNIPIHRQRFTIAHEFGHIIMPHRAEFYACYPGKNKAMERAANKFAAELLMPAPMVRRLWEKYASNPANRVEVVAGILKVSKSALRARLRELGL